MSTRSGKRIQSSPQDVNNGEHKPSRNGIKTRSKHLTKDSADEQLTEKKRKKHYVKYPTEEIIDESDSNGKSNQTLRKSRRNTLKERNVNDTSAEESELTHSQKTTRRTKRCEDPDDKLIAGEKKKKSKKKKMALVVNENKLQTVENEIIIPSKKKSNKKKNKKKSSSIIVEEVVEHPKGLNTSETSVDSFHSAAGSPKHEENCEEHNMSVKKSTPKKMKYSTEMQLSPSISKSSTTNKIINHTVNQNVSCKRQNSYVSNDDKLETRRLRKRKSSTSIAKEADEDDESTEDCTTKQSKNTRKKKRKILNSFDENDLISNSCKEKLKDSEITFKRDDAAYTKLDKKNKANSSFDEIIKANTTFDNKNNTNTTYDKEDHTDNNIYDKEDRLNGTFDNQNKTHTKFDKNDKRNSTYTKVVRTNMSFDKGNKANTTFDKEDKLNDTFDKDKMNTTFEKKSNPNSMFDKNDKSNSTFIKENRSSITFDTENKANSTIDKEDKANTTFGKVNKANGTFDKHDEANSTLNKEERANTTFDKEDKTNTTFDKEERTNTTFDKEDRSNITFDKKDRTNITFDKEDRSNTTFDKENKANITFDKEDKVNITFNINGKFDKKDEDNTAFENKDKANSTFHEEDKANITFDKSRNTSESAKKVNKNGEINNKILKMDSENSPKRRNSAVKERSSIKVDKNIFLSNISNDNSNDSILTSDTSKSSHVSVTSDESQSENILNNTPLLVESSLEEENIFKSSSSPTPCYVNTTIHPTPLKREGTFTKESPEVKVSKNKKSVDKTPTRRKSLPSPGCTPFPHAKPLSKDKSILNITRSIEKSRRSSIAEMVPRATKVIFCSPSNNPVVVSQIKGKIIKSSLKGSNKSFVFEDNSCSSQPRVAGRKRSQTADRVAGVEPHAKRSRLAEHPAPSPRPTRLRTRTLSASAKFPEVISAAEKADSPAKERVRTRLPNFAALHARRFARMESLDECQRRRAERARLLLTPTGPVAVDRVSPKENQAPKESQSIAVKKSETPTKGKPTPLTGGYSRFGFKLQADVGGNPFSFTASKAASARAEARAVAAAEARAAAGLKRQATMPSLAGTTRKQLARQVVMREKSFTGKRDDNRLETRTVIKGVRTNRRFELQMKMRNINT